MAKGKQRKMARMTACTVDESAETSFITMLLKPEQPYKSVELNQLSIVTNLGVLMILVLGMMSQLKILPGVAVAIFLFASQIGK